MAHTSSPPPRRNMALPGLRARYGAAVLMASVLLGSASAATRTEIRKFDVGPKAQAVFKGFTAVGPDTRYSPELGYGWTRVPQHFAKFRLAAFPDALTCDLAAPSKPYRGGRCGWNGSFEFRVDVPAGEYQVHVLCGDYNYLPSAVGTRGYDVKAGQYRPVMPFQEIRANGQRGFYEKITTEGLVRELYHDMDVVLRRDMTLWDRVIAWRFPGRSFKAAVQDDGLLLRFAHVPVNAIIVYPESQAAAGKAFMDGLDKARRKAFPARDVTPRPQGTMPPLPADAKEKGYFLFVPHYSDVIHTNTIPKADWMKDEVRAFASLGEYESFVFCVYPLKDLADCEVSVSDLRTREGAVLPGSAADVRVLRYYEKVPSFLVPSYVVHPYIPLKWAKIPIDRGINRTYWLTIHVPEDAAPGIYHGKITFSPANAPPSSLKLTFRVLPIRLRPLTDRFHALYWDRDSYPGGGPDRRVQNLMHIGFNVIHTAGRMKLTYKDGRLGPLDMSDWDQRLDVYRRNGFPMRLVISQGALYPAYSATGEYRVEPEYAHSAHAVKDHFSAKFEDCYKKYARALADEFKKRGWPDIIFYEGGELACEGPRGVRTETHLMRLLHEAGVKNTSSISGSAMALSLQNSLPYMYLAIIHKINPAVVNRIRECGSKLGIYGPAETRFQRGFWFWRTDAIVSSEEGGVISYANPYDDLDGLRNHWGDVYPTPDGPAPSRHTLGKREGIDDSKYLCHLAKVVAEAEQSASPRARQAAAKAQDVLDRIRRGINLDIDYYRTVADPPSGEVLDLLRYKVAKQIMAVEEAMKK